MKKLLSAIMAMFMILSTSQVAFATNNDDLSDEKPIYLVYDAETGERTSHYSLCPVHYTF